MHCQGPGQLESCNLCVCVCVGAGGGRGYGEPLVYVGSSRYLGKGGKVLFILEQPLSPWTACFLCG